MGNDLGLETPIDPLECLSNTLGLVPASFKVQLNYARCIAVVRSIVLALGTGYRSASLLTRNTEKHTCIYHW